MALLRELDRNGDPLRWLVCTWANFTDDTGFIDLDQIIRDIDDSMEVAGIAKRIRDKITSKIEAFLWELLYGDLNFLIDYYFNGESPIPGWAQ
jgi:hypothetical protein